MPLPPVTADDSTITADSTLVTADGGQIGPTVLETYGDRTVSARAVSRLVASQSVDRLISSRSRTITVAAF